IGFVLELFFPGCPLVAKPVLTDHAIRVRPRLSGRMSNSMYIRAYTDFAGVAEQNGLPSRRNFTDLDESEIGDLVISNHLAQFDVFTAGCSAFDRRLENYCYVTVAVYDMPVC